MATNNFVNDKNGIFVLPEDYIWVDDDYVEYDTDAFLNNFDTLLREQNWQLETVKRHDGEDTYYTYIERNDGYTILDDHGLIAGTIYFESGYYEGVQVIYKNVRDVFDDRGYTTDDWDGKYCSMREQGFSRKYAYAIKCLKDLTEQLQKVGQFSNGSAIYERA